MTLKLGYYQHYKGNVYCVTEVGLHTETGEALAVYKKWDEDKNELVGPLWIRPVTMFYDVIMTFKDGTGIPVPRFKRLPEGLQGEYKDQ